MYNQGTDNPLAAPVGGVIIYRRPGWAVAGVILHWLIVGAIIVAAWTAGSMHGSERPSRQLHSLMGACVAGRSIGIDTASYACRQVRK